MTQNILNDSARELFGIHLIGVKIAGNIKKCLIDRVDMNIFGGNIGGINSKNLRTNLKIVGHGRLGDNKTAARGFFVNLKKTGPSRDTEGFQGGRDGETDSFFGT